MIIAAVTRSLAGVLTGYVLQRGSCVLPLSQPKVSHAHSERVLV